MFKTLYLGTLQGARIYIHWSFWLLAIFIFLTSLGGGLGHAVATLGFVFAVFACVFLHELGHAVAAKAFGRRTHDITLLPIGGIARIEGGEMTPRAEGWVAIAGPAVNFAIAFALLFGVSLSVASVDIDAAQVVRWTPVQQLIAANLILAIFNLLPAFPLDGGRILRSVLCYWMSRAHAVKVSSQVGKITAGLLIASSIVWWNFMGILFGIVLYLINAAQGIQVQLTPGGASPFPDPFGPSPFGRDPWSRPSEEAMENRKTIDAIDVREVPRP